MKRKLAFILVILLFSLILSFITFSLFLSNTIFGNYLTYIAALLSICVHNDSDSIKSFDEFDITSAIIVTYALFEIFHHWYFGRPSVIFTKLIFDPNDTKWFSNRSARTSYCSQPNPEDTLSQDIPSLSSFEFSSFIQLAFYSFFIILSLLFFVYRYNLSYINSYDFGGYSTLNTLRLIALYGFSILLILPYILIGKFNIFYFILSMVISFICYKLFNIYDNTSLNILSKYKAMLPSLSSVLGKVPEPLFIFIYLYMLFIFTIRSFFLKERPGIFYFIGLITIINLTYKNVFFPFITFGSYVLFHLIFGLYLINLDRLGYVFSDVLINYSNTPFSLGFTALQNKLKQNRFSLVRYVSFRSNLGVIFGKTPMSSTGRASLVICVVSGAGYMLNAHLDRKSTERIEAANRQSTERVEAANRQSTERIEAAKLALQREQLEYQKAKDAKSSWW
jgi:hypothetical protein